jgi:hypothetical protein
MNPRIRQYIFGLIFFAVGIYHLYLRDALEASLYAMAGLAFVVNTLALEPRFIQHKKVLGIITWVLIIITIVIFLYLIQFKYL